MTSPVTLIASWLGLKSMAEVLMGMKQKRLFLRKVLFISSVNGRSSMVMKQKKTVFTKSTFYIVDVKTIDKEQNTRLLYPTFFEKGVKCYPISPISQMLSDLATSKLAWASRLNNMAPLLLRKCSQSREIIGKIYIHTYKHTH